MIDQDDDVSELEWGGMSFHSIFSPDSVYFVAKFFFISFQTLLMKIFILHDTFISRAPHDTHYVYIWVWLVLRIFYVESMMMADEWSFEHFRSLLHGRRGCSM